ncbi:MAG: hypothetical protein QOK28_1705 [Actinomycetota bacterium]|jgi:hypothetical protein
MDAYAVLGLRPSASDAEIRDAYLRRSKELHPDRYAEATEADRARATRAMQELNVAYDELRHRVAAPVAAPAREPSDLRVSPRPVRQPPAAAPSPRRKRWIAVSVAALFLASALIALTDNNDTPRLHHGPNATFDVARLEGACITLDNAGVPDEVIDCTRPHDARVMRVVDHGTECPIWTDGSAPATPDKDLCLDTHQ